MQELWRDSLAEGLRETFIQKLEKKMMRYWKHHLPRPIRFRLGRNTMLSSSQDRCQRRTKENWKCHNNSTGCRGGLMVPVCRKETEQVGECAVLVTNWSATRQRGAKGAEGTVQSPPMGALEGCSSQKTKESVLNEKRDGFSTSQGELGSWESPLTQTASCRTLQHLGGFSSSLGLHCQTSCTP